MKKLIIIMTSIVLLVAMSLNISAEAGDARSWYIKRNGTRRPALDKDQEIIYDYNGYYIDKRLTDECPERKLYLTFDLGYSNENVTKILDALERHGIPAAFFILDNIILKNTDLVTRMINSGHLICNHSKNHKDLSFASSEEIRDDLQALESIMIEKTGHKLSKYFRFPEGRYSASSLAAVSELGYKSIFWSFAYEDWDNARQMPVDKAFKKIMGNTHNGAVMLFHPTSKTNADIFDRLIIEWKSMGYEFGTLDELTA